MPRTVGHWLLLVCSLSLGHPATAASVVGAVIENSTARPLARVEVTLEARQSAEARQALSTLTKSGGQFQFPDVPPGIYLLRAQKRGYATEEYGQRHHDAPGTPIVLEADGQFVAELRLKRMGVITGGVTDENQVGLPDFPVYAYRAGERLKMAAVAETDDRGVYRLAGLEPGRYVVCSAARQLEGGYGLLPTYFGQTTSARQARSVEVRLDEEARGIHIAPAPGRLATLHGTVIGGADRVALATDTGPREVRPEPGGRFAFGQLAPGRYKLLAELRAGAQRRVAYREILVGDEQVNVVIEMGPAPLLHIRCQGAAGEQIDPGVVSIFLRHRDFGDTSERLACAQTAVWSPGDWEIAVAPPPQYCLLAILDARSGDNAHEFTLKTGESRDVTLLLSSEPASLKGKVLTSDGQPAIGAPVFLHACDAELRSRLGGVRTARTDHNGEYWFAGLPPGCYEAVSSYQIRGQDQEQRRLGLGANITLEAGAEQRLDLPLIGLE